MQTSGQKHERSTTGKKTGIWLALSAAFGLHFILLFLPITQKTKPVDNTPAQIELQLTTLNSQPEVVVAEPPPIKSPAIPEPVQKIVEPPIEIVQPVLKPEPRVSLQEHFQETPSELEKKTSLDSILAQQFIRIETATDQLFGQRVELHNSDPHTAFQFPEQENMITLLNQPMPELPFAYKAGLVNFAYDPGIKGDLQRFWDVITPEFGWRTKHGTEVRCIWILVIGGCGWK
jgi:hypothetical protein